MAEAPHKDSTWLGIPMKHVSLVTVKLSCIDTSIRIRTDSEQLTLQNSALIMVRNPTTSSFTWQYTGPYGHPRK